jgi:hypothetical protein
VESFFHRDVPGAPPRRQILEDLLGEHDDERLRPGAGFAAYEEGAHCERRGVAGPKRLRDRRQRCGASSPELLVGLVGRQGGFADVAAIECGGFWRRVFLDRQRQGALPESQVDPVSEAPLFCLRNALLQSPLGVGPRRVGAGWGLLGDVGLEGRPCRAPGIPTCLGTDRMPTQDIADTLIRTPLSPLRIEEGHGPGPGAQQWGNLGCGNGRNGMEPRRREVFDSLAFAHAPVADPGELRDAQSCLALGALCRTGLWSWRMAGTDFDRDGRAVRGAA